MDLTLTTEQAAMRDEVRVWLAENVPPEQLPHAGTPEGLAAHKEWELRLFHAGFAAVDWPVAYGGRGLDPMSTAIFYDEYAKASAPGRLNAIGLGLVGPTLLDFGTSDQLDRWLEGTLRSDLLWCQGFSEPGAGSDLASLRTRGVVNDDTMVINGQKIWTSHSRFADWMIAMVRTGAGTTGHRGITFVGVDMRTPGVEVRPIQQLNGAADFSEVFFTDVEVPLSNVIGEVDDGWRVALACLAYERGGGMATAAHVQQLLNEVIAKMSREQRTDPLIRAEVGRLHEKTEAYRYVQLRALSHHVNGQDPGLPGMAVKVWWSELQVEIFELGLLVDAAVGGGAAGASQVQGDFEARYWLARAAQIFAGTSEIQRNIIAERGLGLPREPRVAV
jgi:alkylation response protein AidB-like acyl-CoA dehydrogenase